MNIRKKNRNGADMVYNHEPMRHTARVIERFKLIPINGNTQSVPSEFRNRKRGEVNELSAKVYHQNHRRLNPDVPCKTITASFYSSFVHPFQHRNITVREAARVQGFPDSFKFLGKRTTLSKKLLEKKGIFEDIHLDQFNQVGNAVSPPVAEAIGKYLKTLKNVMTINCLDLFAGCGGFALGLKEAGITTKAAIEIDRFAVETFRHNFPKVDVHHRDITSFSNKEIESNFSDIDLIVGGPPCQGFSVAGPSQYGKLDDRNNLVLEYLRFVKVISPNMVIMENVKNFINGKLPSKDKVIDVVSNILDELGYDIKSRSTICSKIWSTTISYKSFCNCNKKRLRFIISRNS